MVLSLIRELTTKPFTNKKKNEPALSPRYQFTSAYWSPIIFGSDNVYEKFIKTKMKNKNLIPLRGPINMKTLTCNESGIRKIANNDKYGFKNPNSIYKKKIKILLLGDSNTHGECEDENTDIAGFLRNKQKINTANYGISGGGPLLSLAALTEYGDKLQPDNVIYFYSEENDMQDLKKEKEIFLINYLGDFKQNLVNRKDEVKKFLDEHKEIAYNFHKEKLKSETSKFNLKISEEIKKSQENKSIEMIKDFLELQKLKKVFSSKSYYFNNDNSIDSKLFTEVLLKMKSKTEELNGNFIFVYLPSWTRFNSKYSLVKFLHKRKIEKIVKSLNINYIDIVKEFEKNEEPINYYPFGIRGHYTTEGYSLIATTIYNNILD